MDDRDRSANEFHFEYGLPPDPGYENPGYIDVLLPAPFPLPSNDSGLATPIITSAGCSSHQHQPRRRRPHPHLVVTTPSCYYPIELYDDERLISIECGGGSVSQHKAHWDTFRQYIEQYKPVKIQDIALFRQDTCTAITASNANKSAADNELSGRSIPGVVLSTDIHTLPSEVLDTVITVQCAFHPPSTSETMQDSTDDIECDIYSAQAIDMAISSSFSNNTAMRECILPTFMGQEDQVTTEMTLREAIERRHDASSSMVVCVAQLPIASADDDDDFSNTDNEDAHRPIRLRLDGNIEQVPSEGLAKGDIALMSHLSSNLRLPSYLLLGDINSNDEEDGSVSNDVEIYNMNNKNSNIVIHSVNLWHAPQACCTNVHYDDHDNLLIVTEGTKTVELCPPGCIRGSGIYSEHANHPALLRNIAEVGSLSFQEECKIHLEIEAIRGFKRKYSHIVSVSAGEALYIPPGWWHRVVSSPSSSGVGCTAINVWFHYRHPSRINHIVPRHMMPFQVRCIARRYYEMNEDYSASVLLELKRRDALVKHMTSRDNVLDEWESITEDFNIDMMRVVPVSSASTIDYAPCCKTFAESWLQLLIDCDDANEYEIVNRFRRQLEYYILHLDLYNAIHARALVWMWTFLPLPTEPILRGVKSGELFTKVMLQLSPVSCYMVTRAWELFAKHDNNQAEASYKQFFELTGGGEFSNKVRRHLAMGVDEFRGEIFQMGVLDRVLMGRL
jgi:hypothetical protein